MVNIISHISQNAGKYGKLKQTRIEAITFVLIPETRQMVNDVSFIYHLLRYVERQILSGNCNPFKN